MKQFLILLLATAVFAAPFPQEAESPAKPLADVVDTTAATLVEEESQTLPQETTIEETTEAVKEYRITPDVHGDFDLDFNALRGVQRSEIGTPEVIRFTFPDSIPFELTYVANELGFRPMGNLNPERPLAAIDQFRRAELVDEINDYLEKQFNPRTRNEPEEFDIDDNVHTIFF